MTAMYCSSSLWLNRPAAHASLTNLACASGLDDSETKQLHSSFVN